MSSDRCAELAARAEAVLAGLPPRKAEVVRALLQEHQATEERLARGEDELRTLFEQAAVGVARIETSTGRVAAVNMRCCEIAGFGREEMTGITFTDLTHPDDLQAYRDNMRHLRRGERRFFAMEMRWKTKTGGAVWVNISVSALWKPGESPTFHAAIIEDITERRRAEAQVLYEREQARMYIDTVETLIVALDREGRVTTLNRKGSQILGYAEGELMGRFWFRDYLPQPEGMRDIYPFFLQLIRGEIATTEYMENPILTRSGEVRYIAWHNSLLRDERGVVVGTLSSGEDITERKRLDEELRGRARELAESNRELEAFSFSVSHDLRAPLRAIAWFSQALLEDYASVLDDAGRGFLKRIEAGVQRMETLIADMLRLSQITRTELHIERFDLSTLARQVVDELLLARSPEAPAVEVRIRPTMIVRADRGLIRIALTNLLDNALKYTAQAAHPRVEFAFRMEKGERVFFVADNGTGFDMKYADRLFTPFQRLHGDPAYPGTGIGLPIVLRVIRRHGGWIRAHGVPGEGAAFFFTIPERA